MPKLLVLAETDGSHVLPSTLAAVTFAQQWSAATGGDFDLLIVGDAAAAEGWADLGAGVIFVAEAADLVHPTADRVAAICVDATRVSGAESLAGPASSFGRDVLPRAAGLLDLPMISDVMALEREDCLKF